MEERRGECGSLREELCFFNPSSGEVGIKRREKSARSRSDNKRWSRKRRKEKRKGRKMRKARHGEGGQGDEKLGSSNRHGYPV